MSNIRQCKWRKCKNAKLILQGHTSTKYVQLQANEAVSGNNPPDTPAKIQIKTRNTSGRGECSSGFFGTRKTKEGQNSHHAFIRKLQGFFNGHVTFGFGFGNTFALKICNDVRPDSLRKAGRKGGREAGRQGGRKELHPC